MKPTRIARKNELVGRTIVQVLGRLVRDEAGEPLQYEPMLVLDDGRKLFWEKASICTYDPPPKDPMLLKPLGGNPDWRSQ